MKQSVAERGFLKNVIQILRQREVVIVLETEYVHTSCKIRRQKGTETNDTVSSPECRELVT
jgi:hypothetical protein